MVSHYKVGLDAYVCLCDVSEGMNTAKEVPLFTAISSYINMTIFAVCSIMHICKTVHSINVSIKF